MERKIKTALISVFDKDKNIEKIIKLLWKHKVEIISTGGTFDFIRQIGVPAMKVEKITGMPSIFGGRVKTLNSLIFGGILNRRDDKGDQKEKRIHKIKDIDLVIVDLYPFEETYRSNKTEDEIVEKIDIGGVSLIRAAAKNWKDVAVISSKSQYKNLEQILQKRSSTFLPERKKFAGEAFNRTSMYDLAVSEFFRGISLRYGENPHQEGKFIGNLDENFIQLQGKELSYNNFIDTEAAILTAYDFQAPAFVIVKHMNTCGFAVRREGKLLEAYRAAYKADPVSAFGGILAANRKIEEDIAELIKKQGLFVEVIIAPDFSKKALQIFKEKKNCRILKWKKPSLPERLVRSSFNGFLVESRDVQIEKESDLKIVSSRNPTKREVKDLLTASVLTKHLKSNAVALVKNGTLLAMGCGQTSRIDALEQAIVKAKKFGFDLKGSVLSSEAFFPFPDCVLLAGKSGVSAIIHPGGSKNDQASIDMADKYKMAMVTSGFRHFKH